MCGLVLASMKETLFLILSIFVQICLSRIPDWLVHKLDYPAHIVKNSQDNTLILTNGLVSRTFLLHPGFVTIDLYSHEHNSSALRALGPEVLVYKLDFLVFYLGFINQVMWYTWAVKTDEWYNMFNCRNGMVV